MAIQRGVPARVHFEIYTTELKQPPPKQAVFRGGEACFMCGRFTEEFLKSFSNTIQEQISNPSDPLQAVIVKFKEESGTSDRHIKSTHLFPHPTIDETQLNDMELFFCIFW